MNWQTEGKINRLKDKNKRLLALLEKRNKQFSDLRKKAYDPVLMARLFVELRELDLETFAIGRRDSILMNEADFFIMIGAMRDKADDLLGAFKFEEAQKYIDEMPEIFQRWGGRFPSAKTSLARLIRLGYVKSYSYRHNVSYYVTTDGKWWLIQFTKRLRVLVAGWLIQPTTYRRRPAYNSIRRI